MLGVGCSTLFLVLWTLLESLSPGQRPVQFLWHSTCYKRSYISISAYFWSFNGRYPRWTTKTVQYAGLWRSCEGLGSIFGLEFRIILLMQQMYRLDCRLRSSNVLHRMRPVQGLWGKHRHCKVRVMPECSKNKCGKSVPCSNNKNGSWIVARSTTNMV
jgi:hypothetical protein